MSPCPSSHEVECVFPRAVHTHTHSMLIHRPMQKEFTGFMWTQTADCLILLLILAVFILTPCTALSPALPCVWFIPYTYHKKSCTILRLFFCLYILLLWGTPNPSFCCPTLSPEVWIGEEEGTKLLSPRSLCTDLWESSCWNWLVIGWVLHS